MAIHAQNRAGILVIKDRDARRLVDRLQQAAFDIVDVRMTIGLKNELEKKYPEVVKEIKEKDPLFFQDVERIIIRSKTKIRI